MTTDDKSTADSTPSPPDKIIQAVNTYQNTILKLPAPNKDTWVEIENLTFRCMQKTEFIETWELLTPGSFNAIARLVAPLLSVTLITGEKYEATGQKLSEFARASNTFAGLVVYVPEKCAVLIQAENLKPGSEVLFMGPQG